MVRAWIQKIRQGGRFFFDLLFNQKLKTHMLQAFPFWIASLLTGIIAVVYARLFSYAEDLSHFIFTSYRWIIFILAPVCFLVAWLLVKIGAPAARGSGIPQVMAAIDLEPKHNHQVKKLLGLRIIFIKIFSSLVMVVGGAAVGREGPTIQIAGSVFYVINKWIPKSWPKLSSQSFILTGAAAGLAAAFNTPLGGVVFAMEELAKVHIRFFRTALFTAVIIAGLTAQAILGPYLYLGFPVVSNLKFTILFGCAATAIIAGLGGAIMSRIILRLMQWRSTFHKLFKNALFVVGAGLLIAFIAYYVNSAVLGSGKEIMTKVLFTGNKYEAWHTVLWRMVGPAICFSTGAAGGIFAPSLAAGATMGSFIAGFFEITGSNANIIILSGMVGFLTGVTRSPFTSAILVLEMTDRHSVIFHLMLSAMMANISAYLIDRTSFYEHLKKGYLQEVKEIKNDAPADNSSQKKE